jgi:ATP-dependent protease ClpP protease subunit
MRKLIFPFVCLLLAIPCEADTFTNRETGEVFQGYATQRKRGNTTLVRIGNKQKPKYIYLGHYDVEWNYSGRRNQVTILPIKTQVGLVCETEAFEKAIEMASNQGPLCILIEVDTPGGRVDLMRRICDAITKANYCRTVAFVSGGEYGGAYSAGALIALACDHIYMAEGTAIGAAATILTSPSGTTDLKTAFGETIGEKLMSADRAYIATIAEQNGRSGLLAKAMVDKDIEVLEVIEDGHTVFIAPENKKKSQSVERVWSKKGSLLTLTAAEAVKCRMADKVVARMEQIISDLGLEKPRLVRNRDIIKARRQFESAQRKLKKANDDIDYLVKTVDSLRSRFYSVTSNYNREVNNLNDMIRYSSARYASAIESQKDLLEKISSKQDSLKSALLRSLRKLASKYKVKLSLGKYNPDLPVEEDVLNQEINSIDVIYKSLK